MLGKLILCSSLFLLFFLLGSVSATFWEWTTHIYNGQNGLFLSHATTGVPQWDPTRSRPHLTPLSGPGEQWTFYMPGDADYVWNIKTNGGACLVHGMNDPSIDGWSQPWLSSQCSDNEDALWIITRPTGQGYVLSPYVNGCGGDCRAALNGNFGSVAQHHSGYPSPHLSHIQNPPPAHLQWFMEVANVPLYTNCFHMVHPSWGDNTIHIGSTKSVQLYPGARYNIPFSDSTYIVNWINAGKGITFSVLESAESYDFNMQGFIPFTDYGLQYGENCLEDSALHYREDEAGKKYSFDLCWYYQSTGSPKYSHNINMERISEVKPVALIKSKVDMTTTVTFSSQYTVGTPCQFYTTPLSVGSRMGVHYMLSPNGHYMLKFNQFGVLEISQKPSKAEAQILWRSNPDKSPEDTYELRLTPNSLQICNMPKCFLIASYDVSQYNPVSFKLNINDSGVASIIATINVGLFKLPLTVWTAGSSSGGGSWILPGRIWHIGETIYDPQDTNRNFALTLGRHGTEGLRVDFYYKGDRKYQRQWSKADFLVNDSPSGMTGIRLGQFNSDELLPEKWAIDGNSQACSNCNFGIKGNCFGFRHETLGWVGGKHCCSDLFGGSCWY